MNYNEVSTYFYTETQAFINEIISGLEDEHLQQNAKQMLLPRSKLELGELIGKGEEFKSFFFFKFYFYIF